MNAQTIRAKTDRLEHYFSNQTAQNVEIYPKQRPSLDLLRNGSTRNRFVTPRQRRKCRLCRGANKASPTQINFQKRPTHPPTGINYGDKFTNVFIEFFGSHAMA